MDLLTHSVNLQVNTSIHASIDSTTSNDDNVLKLTRPTRTPNSRRRYRIRKHNQNDLDKSADSTIQEWQFHGLSEQKALDDLKELSLTEQSRTEPDDLIDKIFSPRNHTLPEERPYHATHIQTVQRPKPEQPHAIGIKSFIPPNQIYRPIVQTKNMQFNEFYGLEAPKMTKIHSRRARTPSNPSHPVPSPLRTMEKRHQTPEKDTGVIRIISATKPEEAGAKPAIDKLRARIMSNLAEEMRTRKYHPIPKRVNGVPELKRNTFMSNSPNNRHRSFNRAFTYPASEENASKRAIHEHGENLSVQLKHFFMTHESPKIGCINLNNSFTMKSKNDHRALKAAFQSQIERMIKGYNLNL